MREQYNDYLINEQKKKIVQDKIDARNKAKQVKQKLKLEREKTNNKIRL